jgi:hypothetical protein
MTLQASVDNIFQQLEASLIQLSPAQYNQKIEILSGATIGQHVRHVIEMVSCLQSGYAIGVINYEKRKRDIVLETSSEAAIQLMHQIGNELDKENKALILEAGFDDDSHDTHNIPTNYFREIAYNLEHAIHHMALIKIGFQAVSKVPLPAGYGVASSTIKHRRQTQLS